MYVTLTDDEVREALIKTACEKISYVLQPIQEGSFFEVRSAGEDIEDVESVSFVVGF